MTTSPVAETERNHHLLRHDGRQNLGLHLQIAFRRNDVDVVANKSATAPIHKYTLRNKARLSMLKNCADLRSIIVCLFLQKLKDSVLARLP
jgi:hypothetical protein